MLNKISAVGKSKQKALGVERAPLHYGWERNIVYAVAATNMCSRLLKETTMAALLSCVKNRTIHS